MATRGHVVHAHIVLAVDIINVAVDDLNDTDYITDAVCAAVAPDPDRLIELPEYPGIKFAVVAERVTVRATEMAS